MCTTGVIRLLATCNVLGAACVRCRCTKCVRSGMGCCVCVPGQKPTRLQGRACKSVRQLTAAGAAIGGVHNLDWLVGKSPLPGLATRISTYVVSTVSVSVPLSACAGCWTRSCCLGSLGCVEGARHRPCVSWPRPCPCWLALVHVNCYNVPMCIIHRWRHVVQDYPARQTIRAVGMSCFLVLSEQQWL